LKDEKVGKFIFANRLNNIVTLLGVVWLDESEKQRKKTVLSKTIILETVPAKCDILLICDSHKLFRSYHL